MMMAEARSSDNIGTDNTGRGNDQNCSLGGSNWTEWEVFHQEGAQERITQRGCEISILGGFQDLDKTAGSLI